VGAGTLEAGGGRASFAFGVRRRQAGGTPTGHLIYHDRARQLSILGETITAFDVEGDTATFSGTCVDLLRHTPCTFSATATEEDGGGRFVVQIDGAAADGGRVLAGVVRVAAGSSD
jgi:hypothetical protein